MVGKVGLLSSQIDKHSICKLEDKNSRPKANNVLNQDDKITLL